jgi:hypothetical protein
MKRADSIRIDQELEAYLRKGGSIKGFSMDHNLTIARCYIRAHALGWRSQYVHDKEFMDLLKRRRAEAGT